MSEIVENGAPTRAPPWIDHRIQQKIKWRDGDIVISVPPKSGTTWMMNIVHQVLAGGTSDFRDVYEEVPWIEFLAYPGQPHEEILRRIDSLSASRRAFKTHSAPPEVPFNSSKSGRDVKYIVVLRNPEEALVSLRPFLERHSEDWLSLWGMPREAARRPDFPSFYHEIIDGGGMQREFFRFLRAWWPLRGEPNVMFIHFSDMKRDHEASVRRVARFLAVEPGDDRWPTILEHTSFAWMKRHEDKFEARTVGRTRVLESGGMIRRGEVGEVKADGMTEEVSRHLRAVGDQAFPDAEAVDWLYEGGELP